MNTNHAFDIPFPESLSQLPGARDDRLALVEFTADGSRRWSFEEMAHLAGRLAAKLREQEEDQRAPVVLFAPTSGKAMAAALGVLMSGRVIVPLDTQMPGNDLSSVLENCQPKIILTTRRYLKRLQEPGKKLGFTCYTLDEEGEKNDGGEIEGAPWSDLLADEPGEAAQPDPDEPAVMFYTSGTTGSPKGVPLTHRNIISQYEVATDSGLVCPGDRMLLPLPLHHVYPFVFGFLSPMALGLPTILPETLTGPALVRAMREGGATITLGVPKLYEAFFKGIQDKLTAAPGGRFLFGAGLACAKAGAKIGIPLGKALFLPIRRKAAPDLRLLASGGSPLNPELAENLEAIGWPIAVGYGLTETSPLLTVKKPGEGPFSTVGRAVKAVELRVDPQAMEQSETEGTSSGKQKEGYGELLAKGPNVFSGYHRRADEDNPLTEDGWFRTGDVARIDEKGFVYLQGRISTRIALQGGENVDPAQIEDIYGKVEGVGEIGLLEDASKLVALVVPDDDFIRDHGSEEAEAIIRERLGDLGRKLPSYQRLSQIEFTSHPLERTRLGKLRRHALKEAWKDAKDGNQGDPMRRRNKPVTEEELSDDDRKLLGRDRSRALWDLLCSRYSDRPVSPDAHLEMDLGIDSMEWVDLSLQVEEVTGASVDQETISKVNRVRDLIEAMEEAPSRDEGTGREPLKNPESVLGKKDLGWTRPRGIIGSILGGFLYLWLWLIMRCAFRVKIHGLENLPHSPHILAPNHASYLDAPAIGAGMGAFKARRYFWAGATRTMFRNLFIRGISRLGQVVPIDPRRGPVSSLASVAMVLKNNHSMVWFPEGRISADGTLQALRPGIALLLKHQPLPVVPVYIKGTHQALPRGKRWPKIHRVEVWFGKPMEADLFQDTEKDPQALTDLLRERMEQLRKDVEDPGGRRTSPTDS